VKESSVNDQITDAVSQVNALVLGSAVPKSLAVLDMVSAETVGMSMYNAVTAQHNAQISASASITATCAKMLQAEPARPVDPVAATDNPPPFMPLNTENPLSASQLINQAKTLAEAALKMAGKEGDTQNEFDSDLKNLMNTLNAASSAEAAEPKAAPEPKPQPTPKAPEQHNPPTPAPASDDGDKKKT